MFCQVLGSSVLPPFSQLSLLEMQPRPAEQQS